MDNKLTALAVIAVGLTGLDWGLGMLIVRGVLPAWLMAVANLPFGLVYVWTEAQWAGGNYVFDGRVVGEDLVMAAQCLALGAQVLVYYGAWLVWQWFRQKRAAADERPAASG